MAVRRVRKIAKSHNWLRHVRLSVHMEQLGFKWTNFHEIWNLRIFRNSIMKLQVSLTSDKNNRYFTSDQHTFHIISRSLSVKMRNVWNKILEKIKTHILCSVTLYRKSCRSWDNVEIYCRLWQATDDNMAHAHCMLDNEGYKHTLKIWNT